MSDNYCEKCHDYHREVGIESLCVRLTALESRGAGAVPAPTACPSCRAAMVAGEGCSKCGWPWLLKPQPPTPPPPADPGEKWLGRARRFADGALCDDEIEAVAAEFARIDEAAYQRGAKDSELALRDARHAGYMSGRRDCDEIVKKARADERERVCDELGVYLDAQGTALIRTFIAALRRGKS